MPEKHSLKLWVCACEKEYVNNLSDRDFCPLCGVDASQSTIHELNDVENLVDLDIAPPKKSLDLGKVEYV